jgi:hypothetical protein
VAKNNDSKSGKGSGGSGRAGKGTSDVPVEHWKDEPDAHDYPAAADYLSLLLERSDVDSVVAALRKAPIIRRKAKDLLRSSRLALLDKSNPHVATDLAKVADGELLSPVLCVRGSMTTDVALTVADGYHRICASFHLDENADIPCHLVGAPAAAVAAARRAATPATRRARPAAG